MRKVCGGKCAQDKPLTDFSRDSARRDGRARICKVCQAAYAKGYRKRNRVRLVQQSRDWYSSNKEYAKQYHQEWRLRLRQEVLSHYAQGTPACKCCGETIECFLTLDHRDGGGRKHREEVRRQGTLMYVWLKRHGFPEGFDVLCFNCNCGRHINGGVCPHKDRYE
jgi:hypothetical protein